MLVEEGAGGSVAVNFGEEDTVSLGVGVKGG